ncbi:MAG TPA: hypothetical protein VEB86_19400 [Chryseosolibacter sp.]|nr:hypothetical protein [Chryseosolibacter sp.]
MKASSTIGGLAGAVALTLLNESIKKFNPNAPRRDLLGKNALAKLMKGNDVLPQTAQKFFPLAGDLVTNSLYYGMARGTGTGNTFLRGILLGVTAGIGAVTLPTQVGIEEKHTNKNMENTLMTIGWYVVGGLVAAAVISALDRGKKIPEDKELEKGVRNVTKKVGQELAQTV